MDCRQVGGHKELNAKTLWRGVLTILRMDVGAFYFC